MISDKGILAHYAESKKIITEARNDGQLVIFIGAGASICSGMPAWPQAIKEIASHLGISDEKLDFLRIPQYYFNARGKKEYTQLMRKIFHHGDFLLKHEIHDRIIEFNTNTIITTNYDNLIEKAAEDNSEVIFVVSKDTDLPYRKGGKELIKIHGDFENDNFVLKEDDYLSYSRNFRLIENYVKSIIGTKIVLFIGYSFNDPDIKQIFSWAKDILDGDFQRAYLIEAGKEYDANEADYYKNFGINVLYASLQLNNDFKKNDLTQNLLNMLKWLLNGDKLAKLDELYDNLKSFRSMNFVSNRYVQNAFINANYILKDDKLTVLNPKIAFNESSEIIKNFAYEQYGRISSLESNEGENKNELKKKEHLHNFIKDFNPKKNHMEKTKILLDILKKSEVHYIEFCIPKNDKNTSWYYDSIELENYNIPDWVEAVNTFDYYALKDIVDTNNSRLSETQPQLYTEQGYLYYILKEYLAAYNCFKMAASIYYRHRKYINYFIAEFNRYFVGKFIIDNGIFSGVSDKDINIVKEEINAINLERTFRSLPNLGDNNKVLKDIYTFNIAYTLFQDAYLASEKVKEQANSNYILFSGTAAFSSMRKSMTDYHNYIILNQLAVDKYIENINIFKIYFQSILGSVMTSDMGLSNPIRSNRTGNIHADKLNNFDLMIALKYEEIKDLQKLLQNTSTNLPLEEDGIKYMLNVISKYRIRPVKSSSLIDDVFWKAVLLLGHCDLNKDLVDKTLDKINECIINPNDYRQYGNIVIRFLNNAEGQCLITKENIKHIESLLKKVLQYLCDNKTETLILVNFVLQIVWLCKKYGHTYDDENTISKLISGDSRILCATIYPHIGEECRKLMYDAYKNWKLEYKHLDFDFYCLLVESKILKPDMNAEQIIFS